MNTAFSPVPSLVSPPRFTGVGRLAVGLVESIDSNKLTELVVTDVGAMVIPRTVIEYKQRGSDAGRETLIREVSGTVANCFLSGWMGAWALKLLKNPTSWLGKRLNALGMRHDAWIQNKHLTRFGEEYARILQDETIQTSEDAMRAWARQLLDGLESTDGLAKMEAFQKLSESPARLTGSAKERLMSLLLDGSQAPGESWKKLAVEGGLTHEVRWVNSAGKILVAEAKRDAFLREAKAFMDHFARKTLEVHDAPLSPALRQQALDKLLKRDSGWLPPLRDGLIPYSRKSKVFLSLIPIALTTLVSCSVSYLNPWWTQRKHQGKLFFPGETAFSQSQSGLPNYSGALPGGGIQRRIYNDRFRRVAP